MHVEMWHYVFLKEIYISSTLNNVCMAILFSFPIQSPSQMSLWCPQSCFLLEPPWSLKKKISCISSKKIILTGSNYHCHRNRNWTNQAPGREGSGSGPMQQVITFDEVMTPQGLVWFLNWMPASKKKTLWVYLCDESYFDLVLAIRNKNDVLIE